MVSGILEVKSGEFAIRTNAPQFEELFRQAPREVLFQARSMMGRWFGHARKSHIAALKAAGERGLVRAMNRHGWVKWKVEPFPRAKSERALRNSIESWGTPDIGAIEGREVLRSRAEIALEFGETVQAKSGSLAIPIGKYARMTQTKRRQMNLRSPAQYAKSPEGKQRPLFTVKRKIGGERKEVLVRATGRKTKTGKDTLEPVFILRKSVNIPAKLGMRAAWDRDAGYRQRVLDEHLKRLVDGLGLRLARISKGAA
ncbi:MAG: hypothetical protein KDB80_18630 [Planctomycetes bacterium]|nr:hypothetical protein [Planctomycetota bacterium]